MGCGFGHDQGRRLWLYRGVDGLLSWHAIWPWRPRRGGRHEIGRGGSLGADTGRQLPADRGVFRRMITLNALEKSFGQNHVLRGVTLQVPKGSSMVIIGGSGTGKSVLLKCILGLVTSDRGTITVAGQDILHAKGPKARSAFLDRFGMLFQGGALFDSLPVWHNVAFRLLRGSQAMPAQKARALAVEKLRRVGLGPDVADLFPAE